MPSMTKIAPPDTSIGAYELSPEAAKAALEEVQVIREKILFSLSVYKFLNASMLQVALGTANSPNVWRKVLDELKSDGLVVEESITLTSPRDYTKAYNVIHLAENAFTPPVVVAAN